MTTSMTDARFTSLHFTAGHLASLDFDPPPESGWGVMPGFDESLDIPPSLEPPRLDADETLPNLIHPSYPFGRPAGMGTAKGKGVKSVVGNLLGTVGSKGLGGAIGAGGGSGSGAKRGAEERWDELGIEGLVEKPKGKEIPPGMAGAKRPPSPSSPVLRPAHIPPARSTHLQNLYARQRQATPPPAQDPFDAPVPNETYAQGEGGDGQEGDSGRMEEDGNGV